MSIYRFSMQAVSRARGSSAVGKAAYDARTRLRDERLRRTFDYRARGGLDHAEILRPTHAVGEGSAWALDRSALWNAAEAAETRKNARVAREFVVALPHELSREQRLALSRRFAQSIADRYGTVVDLAVHNPPAGGDPRNFHAHVLSTTRALTDHGLGAKTPIERSGTARHRLGLPPGVEELKMLRRHWSELANEQLREAGIPARIDHRSLRDQGIDRAPQRRLSMATVQIERRRGNSVEAVLRRAQPLPGAAPDLAQSTEQGGAPPPGARNPAGQQAPAASAVASLDERQQAAAARWLAYRREREAGVGPARPSRDRALEPTHDFGAEL